MGFQKTENELRKYINSNTPLIFVQTQDENELMKSIKNISGKKPVIKWSRGGGLKIEKGDLAELRNIYDPLKILAIIKAFDMDAIFVLEDYHLWLGENKDYILNLKEAANVLYENMTKKIKNVNIIVTSPSSKIPLEIQKLSALVKHELPDYFDIEKELNNFLEEENIILEDEEKAKVINASLGLNMIEIKNNFKKNVVVDKEINPKFLVTEKQEVIQKDGLLKYIKAEVKTEDVGGLKNLISWVEKRSLIFDDNLREKYNISVPKGMLITGVPGTGKSYSAKMIASYLKMPLIGLDIGGLMSMWVGESEENLNKALNIVEMIAPCVLWIDEFDKAIPDLSSNQSHETTKRMMSTLLTWLQEKKEKVFVVATANNIHHLPPEIMRKGRFDEIFFVDLPKDKEREEILAIHLKRKGLKLEKFDLKSLSEKTEGFSGSEIESAINEGCVLAAFENTDVSTKHILEEIEKTNPLSKTMEDEIKLIQEWAETFQIRQAN